MRNQSANQFINIKNSFSENFIILLENSNLNDEELGKRIDISLYNIKGFRTGKLPSFSEIIKLSIYFDVNALYLLGLDLEKIIKGNNYTSTYTKESYYKKIHPLVNCQWTRKMKTKEFYEQYVKGCFDYTLEQYQELVKKNKNIRLKYYNEKVIKKLLKQIGF